MGFFNRLFSKEQESHLLDLSLLGTDLHSHLIPGLDDGSTSMEESLEMIGKMHELGFKRLFITPHVMSDFYKNSKETILLKLEELKSAVKVAGIPIELNGGAEYLVDDGFLEKVKNKELITIGEKYILLELPFYNLPDSFNIVLFELQISGYKVILAHPERYSYWHEDISKYEDLKNRDVYFQINLTSLGGYYSGPVKRIAEKLIDHDMVDFIGSDLHKLQGIREIKATLQQPYLENLICSDKLLNHTL